MTTRDYVYLGLILLTALAFYCNGFYAGVYRCKRMYDSLLDDNEETSLASLPGTPSPEQDVNPVSESEKVFAGEHAAREVKVALSNRELRGDFGKN
jgi:hypothetical protein